MSLVLHGYWRSSAAYRVRIALNLKGVDHRHVTHDLREGAQRAPDYRTLAPIGLVPALETDDGQILTQSLAILEWLEERYSDPPLLPGNVSARASVRAMASLVACDIHPINNLRVLNALREELGAETEAVRTWIARWIRNGFAALEVMASGGRRFCFGDTPTFADCCLVPQIYNARRFGVDLDAFPTLLGIEANCRALDAFIKAAPENQPDADGPAT